MGIQRWTNNFTSTISLKSFQNICYFGETITPAHIVKTSSVRNQCVWLALACPIIGSMIFIIQFKVFKKYFFRRLLSLSSTCYHNPLTTLFAILCYQKICCRFLLVAAFALRTFKIFCFRRNCFDTRSASGISIEYGLVSKFALKIGHTETSGMVLVSSGYFLSTATELLQFNSS